MSSEYNFIKGYLLAVNAPFEIMDALDVLGGGKIEKKEKQPNPFVDRPTDLFDTDYEIPYRVWNRLKEMNIRTSDELASLGIDELRKQPRIGKVTIMEFVQLLKSFGKEFKGEVKLVRFGNNYVYPYLKKESK